MINCQQTEHLYTAVRFGDEMEWNRENKMLVSQQLENPPVSGVRRKEQRPLYPPNSFGLQTFSRTLDRNCAAFIGALILICLSSSMRSVLDCATIFGKHILKSLFSLLLDHVGGEGTTLLTWS
jgi:hypothetical protein